MAKAVEKKRVLHRRRIIERPRLIALLDETNVPIRMLIAPAGYGKTTLAEQWVAKEGRRGTWFTARPASVDVAGLALGLARAAAGIVPDCEERLREHLRALPAPAENVRVLAEILSEDIAGWPSDAWLVFDDYHEICPSADAERFVEELVSLCPVQILIASRQRPSWVKARRILYGEVFELNQTQLAMDGHEAAEVLSGRNATSASGLVALANGWPAVIGLAAVSPTEVDDQASVPEALYQFFAEEIFSALEPDVQRGLAVLAIAPIIDRSLVDGLLEDGAERVLGIALDIGILVERDGRLEMHPLARAFLDEHRDQGSLPVPAEQVEKCLELIRNQRAWDTAFDLVVRHSLLHQLPPLLQEALDELLDTARLSTIEGWCDYADEMSVTSDIFTLGRAEIALRRGQCAEAQARGVSMAAVPSPYQFRALVVAGRAAHLASREEDALQLFRRAEHAASSKFARREALWDQLICMTDLELPQASATLEDLAGEVEFSNIREVVKAETCRLLWQLRFGQLDLSRADRTAQLLPLIDDPIVVTGFQSVLASGLALSGRYEEARNTALALASTARKYRLAFALPWALVVMGTAEAGLRNWRQAERLLRQGMKEARRGSDRHAEESCLAGLIRMLAQRGRSDLAIGLRLRSVLTGDESQLMQTVRAELLSSRALALAASGRVAEAERTIEPARGVSRAVEAVVLSAAVDAVIGLKSHSQDAIDRVEALHQVAFDTGGVDLLVTAYRAAPELLAVLLQKGRRDHAFVDLVRRVGDCDLVEAVGGSLAAGGCVTALTARQRDVYALLRQGLTNREIATTLVIAESTAKLHVQNVFDRLGIHSRKTIAMQAALERSPQATSAIDETGEGSDS
jgi:LuxR family transcriptional regulator, maltose regulon positive regulatory protein